MGEGVGDGDVDSFGVGGGSSAGGSVEFADNTFRVQDVTDTTKQLAFQVSGVTTGTTTGTTVNLTGLTAGTFYYVFVNI